MGTRGGAPGTGPRAASLSPAHTHARGVTHVAVGTHTHSKDTPCAPREVAPEHPVAPVPLTPVCPPALPVGDRGPGHHLRRRHPRLRAHGHHQQLPHPDQVRVGGPARGARHGGPSTGGMAWGPGTGGAARGHGTGAWHGWHSMAQVTRHSMGRAGRARDLLWGHTRPLWGMERTEWHPGDTQNTQSH